MSRRRVLPLDRVLPPLNPSRRTDLEVGLEDLAASIKRRGQITPIMVEPDGENYRTIAGHRRLLAHRMLSAPTIIADVYEVGELDAAALQIIENLQREDLNPVDEAYALQTFCEKFGLSPQDAGKELGKGEGWIKARVDILVWPEEFRAALAHGAISFGCASELVRIDNETYRMQTLEWAIAGGISQRVAKQWRQRWEADKEFLSTPPAELLTDEQEREFVISLPCFLCAEGIDHRELIAVRICEPCAHQVVAANSQHAGVQQSATLIEKEV